MKENGSQEVWYYEISKRRAKAFEALSAGEQRQVTAEIIRRSTATDDLPEAAYHELADELFLQYDAEEASRGTPIRRSQGA